MVRKVQKAKPKASNLKPSTSVKRGTKSKKENLSNGYRDTENEKAENETAVEPTEVEASESSEEMLDTVPEVKEDIDTKTEKHVIDSANQKETLKLEDASSKQVKTAPRSRNRKEATDLKVKKKSDKQGEALQMEDVISEEIETAPISRKRKAAVDTKLEKESITKTKAKKQKVLLEIPKRNTISGKLFVIGENDVGQLGFDEDISEKTRPALLDLPHAIVDIAAGGMHSVCLTESGEVITFGCNDEGALGRVTSEEGSEHIPQKVDLPERIVQISAGDSHSAVLSESGQVYIWGNFRNVNGPMGLVTDGAKQCTPVKILNDFTVVKIASGSDHLACLSREGVVFTCGCGDVGQLGRVSEHASIDGGRKGKILLLKPDMVFFTKSSKSCTVNNIWTGSYATFLNIKETGLMYAFGLNNFSQLGLENQNTLLKPKLLPSFSNYTWLHISGGQHHTLALDDNGLVYSLGRSEYGRLGLGENCDVKSVPTAIPSLQNEKCIDLSCGNCVSFAITDNGSVYSWGMGTNHQLGHGNDSDQHSPRLIEGNFFNCWKAFKISGGGQHTLILAHPRKSLEKSQ